MLWFIAAPVHLSQADLRTTRKKGKSRGGTSGERLDLVVTGPKQGQAICMQNRPQIMQLKLMSWQ